MLAPSTIFVENVLRHFARVDDRNMLFAMRATVACFAILVLMYSIALEGAPIYDMVAMAYQFPVVGAFWPLVCGLYWKKATRQGCYVSILLGSAVWVFLTWTSAGEVFPNVLGGFIAAAAGMVVGSLMPTTDNKRFLEERRRNMMKRPVDAEIGNGRLPAITPVSATA